MFDQEFLDKQKTRLLAEKKDLEETFKKRGGKRDKHVKNVEDYDVQPPHLSKKNEPLDLDLEAQEVAGYANRLSVEKNLEQKLIDINVALKRIDDGKYGQCDNCGNTIPQERLEALPAARICLDCEQKQKK
ncbi:TraR/DksA family transcriptional regulator [Patescibacteria group bacterium]